MIRNYCSNDQPKVRSEEQKTEWKNFSFEIFSILKFFPSWESSYLELSTHVALEEKAGKRNHCKLFYLWLSRGLSSNKLMPFYAELPQRKLNNAQVGLVFSADRQNYNLKHWTNFGDEKPTEFVEKIEEFFPAQNLHVNAIACLPNVYPIKICFWLKKNEIR